MESNSGESGKSTRTTAKPRKSRRARKPVATWVLFAVTRMADEALRLEELALLNSEAQGLQLLKSDKLPEGEYAIVPLLVHTVRFAPAPRIVMPLPTIDRSVIKRGHMGGVELPVPKESTVEGPASTTFVNGVKVESSVEMETDADGYLVVPEGPQKDPRFAVTDFSEGAK